MRNILFQFLARYVFCDANIKRLRLPHTGHGMGKDFKFLSINNKHSNILVLDSRLNAPIGKNQKSLAMPWPAKSMCQPLLQYSFYKYIICSHICVCSKQNRSRRQSPEHYYFLYDIVQVEIGYLKYDIRYDIVNSQIVVGS